MSYTKASELAKAKRDLKLQLHLDGGANLISGFSQIASGAINYNLLKSVNTANAIKADQVRTQAVERSNQLREQFLNSLGTSLNNASRRGIRASSDVVAKNVERSSMNIGKDIQKINDNAAHRADAILQDNKLRSMRAKTAKVGTLIDSLPSFISAGKNYALLSKLGG